MPISVVLTNPPLNEITIALVRTDPSLDGVAAAVVVPVVPAVEGEVVAVTVDPWAGLDVLTEGAQVLSKDNLVVFFQMSCEITMLTGTLWWKLDGADKLSFNLANDRILMTG